MELGRGGCHLALTQVDREHKELPSFGVHCRKGGGASDPKKPDLYSYKVQGWAVY